MASGAQSEDKEGPHRETRNPAGRLGRHFGGPHRAVGGHPVSCSAGSRPGRSHSWDLPLGRWPGAASTSCVSGGGFRTSVVGVVRAEHGRAEPTPCPHTWFPASRLGLDGRPCQSRWETPVVPEPKDGPEERHSLWEAMPLSPMFTWPAQGVQAGSGQACSTWPLAPQQFPCATPPTGRCLGGQRQSPERCCHGGNAYSGLGRARVPGNMAQGRVSLTDLTHLRKPEPRSSKPHAGH